VNLFDVHNHLQDERLDADRDAVMERAAAAGHEHCEPGHLVHTLSVAAACLAIDETELARRTHAAAEEKDRGRPRAPLGRASFLPGLFGLIAAREAITARLGWERE
jgi:hypothetical protein